MYLDLGRWITGSAWCWSGPYRPEGASLTAILYDSMLSTYIKGTWETQNHQTFCMRLVLVSFTQYNLQLHVHLLLKHSTINLSLKIAQTRTPNHQLLGTQGPRDSHDVSVYETCACVIYSATCVHYCHFPVMFARGTCAS